MNRSVSRPSLIRRLGLAIVACVATLALSGCSTCGRSPTCCAAVAPVAIEDDDCAERSPLTSRGRHRGRNGALTEDEMHMARMAWRYFENNVQEETGLANAVNDYPSVTLWDTASYMGGMVAAYELCIIDRNEFSHRMIRLLATLNALDFFRGEVPNKVYNTLTAAKVDYANQPGEIGFSALDLGRLLIWLRIVKERYPMFASAIDQSILRWSFCNMIDERGMMFGATVLPNGETLYVQEGRLGYEEYAAKGFQLWGFNTDLASQAEPYDWVRTYGVDIPFDRRDPRLLTAHNYVVTESYVLDALEFNWDRANDHSTDHLHHSDPRSRDFAERIYAAQRARYEATGILTARTEHQLAVPPYFVYDTIYTDGYAWNTITEDGQHVPEHAAIALKGALGLWAVWEDDYTDRLFAAIKDLYNPEKGFYEGLYENGSGVIETYTSNNNGIMLATLLHKTQGKLVKFSGRMTLWDRVLRDEFLFRQYDGYGKCLPTTYLPASAQSCPTGC